MLIIIVKNNLLLFEFLNDLLTYKMITIYLYLIHCVLEYICNYLFNYIIIYEFVSLIQHYFMMSR